MGVVAGLCVHFGCSVEYQQNDNTHVHGNAHLVSMYQYLSLVEIAELMLQSKASFKDVSDWQSWVGREEHLDRSAHQRQLETLEKARNQQKSCIAAHGLCMLPQYLHQASDNSLGLIPTLAAWRTPVQRLPISMPSISKTWITYYLVVITTGIQSTRRQKRDNL